MNKKILPFLHPQADAENTRRLFARCDAISNYMRKCAAEGKPIPDLRELDRMAF